MTKRLTATSSSMKCWLTLSLRWIHLLPLNTPTPHPQNLAGFYLKSHGPCWTLEYEMIVQRSPINGAVHNNSSWRIKNNPITDPTLPTLTLRTYLLNTVPRSYSTDVLISEKQTYKPFHSIWILQRQTWFKELHLLTAKSNTSIHFHRAVVQTHSLPYVPTPKS